MDDVTRHPDDATLFDLVEGALDDASAARARAHLARCAACAAFVAAARAGGPATTHATESMPEAAAERLQAAVRTAWRDRVSSIAQTEAVEDAAPSTDAGEFAGFAPGSSSLETEPFTAGDPGATDDPGSADARAARPPRRRGRRLVPVLAFVVLGALAGTSIYIGDDAQRPGGDAATQEEQVDLPAPDPAASGGVVSADPVAEPGSSGTDGFDDTNAELGKAPSAGAPQPLEVPAPSGAAGGAAAGEDSAAAPPAADGDAASSEETDRQSTAGSATAVTVEPPPADYDEFVDQDRMCIVTLDETQLVLPNQRLPTQIEPGPFGLFLVCG